MLSLGIDIGTSSVKVSVLDTRSGQCLANSSFPPDEAGILSLQQGWAEQLPGDWWQYTKTAILQCHSSLKYHPREISAIGIAYQMHGLVLVDNEQHVLRNSIIWCDSRAVETGERATAIIGKERCRQRLLNSPANFTASKLAWVKQHEPEIYRKADKMMLPGDFIAMKLTGCITTTPSALSEAILWDFVDEGLSADVMSAFGLMDDIIPEIKPVFGNHGELLPSVAAELSLKAGIPVSYKAGDQLNNALSLNVLQPGEVAATAGTSGVIYAVTNQLFSDSRSRVNSFAHINHTKQQRRLGVLLCINGTGIINRWARTLFGNLNYVEMNQLAASVPPGSEGLVVLPFGNGAERMLQNEMPGAHFLNLDLNKHTRAHLMRAIQEGIAFSFRYGLDIMRENGLNPTLIRAGKTNLFLSDVFTKSFVNATQVPVELFVTNGSHGAAIGAALGAGLFASPADAFIHQKTLNIIEPAQNSLFGEHYEQWKMYLSKQLNKSK